MTKDTVVRSESVEDYKAQADKLKNELLIMRTIEEHLQIEDEETKKRMEKLLIYNLLN